MWTTDDLGQLVNLNHVSHFSILPFGEAVKSKTYSVTANMNQDVTLTMLIGTYTDCTEYLARLLAYLVASNQGVLRTYIMPTT